MTQSLLKTIMLLVFFTTGCDAVRGVLGQNEDTTDKQTQLSNDPESPKEKDSENINTDRPLIKGFDRFGKERSCRKIDPNTACTMSFEPGDQFAADCKAAGKEATQCGCHDYICSAKIAG